MIFLLPFPVLLQEYFSKQSQRWPCHQLSAVCPWQSRLGINASERQCSTLKWVADPGLLYWSCFTFAQGSEYKSTITTNAHQDTAVVYLLCTINPANIYSQDRRQIPLATYSTCYSALPGIKNPDVLIQLLLFIVKVWSWILGSASTDFQCWVHYNTRETSAHCVITQPGWCVQGSGRNYIFKWFHLNGWSNYFITVVVLCSLLIT